MSVRVFIAVQILFLSTVFTTDLVAQAESMSEADYKAAIKIAYSESEKLDRRVTTTTETFAEGKKIGTEIIIEEFQSPDKVRTVVTERSGKKVLTTETIEIDNAKYIRDDSGIWAKWHRTKKPLMKLMGVTPPDEPKEKIVYSSRITRLNRQPVTIYSRVSNKAYGFIIGAETKEIWVNKDNQILKTVITTSEDTSDNVVEKSIVIYDYAPKGLRIEVPIK